MAKARFNGYLTYNWKGDKDPVIFDIEAAISLTDLSYTKVSQLSGVSVGTLYNWFRGPTCRPQHAALMAVAKAVGHELRLLNTATHTIKRKEPKAPKLRVIAGGGDAA